MNKLKYAIATLILTSVAAATFLTTSTFAISGGGFGGRPAHPDPAIPRSHDIFIYTLEASQTSEDAVTITNNSDTSQTIEVYPTDVVITNTGAFSCEQRVEERNDVGAWIHLSKNSVTLAPGTHTDVQFTITAPSKVDVGEHNGCLAFEPKDSQGEVQGNVRIRTRSAVRVAVTVPGDLKKQVDIVSFDTTVNDGGHQKFLLNLINKGNVSADTTSTVTLKTLIGTDVYKNKGTYPVMAGSTYNVIFTNDDKPFWGGWYKASASISYDKQAGQFGTKDSSNLTTKNATDQFIFVLPDPLAIVIYAVVVLLIVLILVYLWYQRREKHDALRNWKSYTVKEDDTIQSLADEYGINWKKLAKINDIKPPYILNSDDKLRIPHRKK